MRVFLCHFLWISDQIVSEGEFSLTVIWWYHTKGLGAPMTSLSLVQSLLLSLSAKEVFEIFPLGLYFRLRSNIKQNLGRCLWWWGGEEKGQNPKNSYSGRLFCLEQVQALSQGWKGLTSPWEDCVESQEGSLPFICWKIKEPWIVWVKSMRFYQSRLLICVRVAFDTKINAKSAKYLGFNQISSSLHQLFPRSCVSTKKISCVIPACLWSFPLLPPYHVMADGCENWSNGATAAGREVFSAIQMMSWPVVTAELFLARDHSTSAAYQAGCVLRRGTVQLAGASSQTWLLLWEQEKAQVLGRDWLCLTCASTILPQNSEEEEKQVVCCFSGWSRCWDVVCVGKHQVRNAFWECSTTAALVWLQRHALCGSKIKFAWSVFFQC